MLPMNSVGNIIPPIFWTFGLNVETITEYSSFFLGGGRRGRGPQNMVRNIPWYGKLTTWLNNVIHYNMIDIH